MSRDDPPDEVLKPVDVGGLLAERTRRDNERHQIEREDIAAELDRTRGRVAELEHRIDEIHGSETWKLGRAAKTVLTPAVAARNAIARRRREDDTADPHAMPLLDHDARERYRAAIARGDDIDAEGGAGTIVFAVYTTDLAEGRGDIYVAVGLGLELEALGWRCRYVPRSRWHLIGPDTNVVVAMIQTFDPLKAPVDAFTVAWVRNETETWRRHRSLSAFDAVICSSEPSREAMAQRFGGPTRVLPLGVDTGVFSPGESPRRGVVTTVNDWGRERQVYRALRSAPIDFDLTVAGHVRLDAPLADQHIGMVDYFALPDLYRRSEAVIDDFNHTTAPFGNINSRLLEALACDAIVITNTDIGLDALGVGELPVYCDDHELAALCRRAAAGQYRSLARELGAHIRAEHSWAARAADLEAMLRDLTSGRSSITRVMGFHPDFRSTNPYQDLLYQALDRSTLIAPVASAFDVTALDLAAARNVPYVHHLHWTSTILGDALDRADAHRRRVAFVDELDRIRRHGASVVWTVHNELPHECAYPDIELQMRRQIAERCDAIHVMCEHSRAIAVGRFGATDDIVFVAPMPAYSGHYRVSDLTPADARAALGIDNGSFVHLFLGTIRPYKGIDALLDAFAPIHSEDDQVALIVAGRPDHPSVPALERRCRATPGVLAHFEEVPDDELTGWFRAADTVVLPYRTGLNSSAVLLAYSLGLPVIAPSIGCIAELLDPACAVAFDPETDGSLEAALRRARDLDPATARQRALEIADDADPAKVSALFAREVESRLRRHAQPDRGDRPCS